MTMRMSARTPVLGKLPGGGVDVPGPLLVGFGRAVVDVDGEGKDEVVEGSSTVVGGPISVVVVAGSVDVVTSVQSKVMTSTSSALCPFEKNASIVIWTVCAPS
jgi:hypothetical protein